MAKLLNKLLNKGLEGLDKVADSRAVALVIQTTNIVVNTGAAPIPNCLGPIVDSLDKLLKTINASKALQKSCSKLINTCDELRTALQTERKAIELTKLEASNSNTIRILEEAEQALVKYTMINRFEAILQRRRMKKAARLHEGRVKTQLEVYSLQTDQEILSGLEEVTEITKRHNERLGALTADLQAALRQSSGYAQATSAESSQAPDVLGAGSGSASSVPPVYPSEDDSAASDTANPEEPESGPRKRYTVHEIPRARYGRAEMILGSKRLEYWLAARSIGGEEILIRMPRDSVERHVRWGMKGIKNELEIWRHLRHPYVVPLLGTMYFNLPQNGRHLGLVSPFYNNGNAIDYVGKKPGANRLQILIDAAQGLEYLHSQFVAHGDVRGSSVLINDQEQAVISDFHMSRFVDIEITWDPNTEDEFEAELHWRAPELMIDYHPPTLKGDIWSFAMTMYEVATGKKPLHADGMRTEVRAMIATRRDGIIPKRPLRNVWLTDDVWSLMERCWNSDPEARPDIQECLEVLRKANETWINEHAQDPSLSS